MIYQTILYDTVEPGVLKTTLSRPEVHNAINHQFITELNAAYEEARDDESVRVI